MISLYQFFSLIELKMQYLEIKNRSRSQHDSCPEKDSAWITSWEKIKKLVQGAAMALVFLISEGLLCENILSTERLSEISYVAKNKRLVTDFGSA